LSGTLPLVGNAEELALHSRLLLDTLADGLEDAIHDGLKAERRQGN
jgi:hypothetical protein